MFSKLCDTIEMIFKAVSAILLFAMFSIILAQVVLRYCFNTGFKWIDGVSVMGFMWIGMLGSALGVRNKSLARVSLVEERLPKYEMVFFWGQHIVCTLFLVVLSYASILFTQQSGSAIYQLLKIPYYVQYISVTIFCFCSILFLIDDVIKRLKGKGGR